MKKSNWIILVIILLIVGLLFVRFVIGGDEDSWIKDENGIWIKHGNPSTTPDYVLEQQKAIRDNQTTYNSSKV
jgi:hypothetical protein